MTARALQRVNHLGGMFYTMPRMANQTMTTREFQETQLYTGGWITACGNTWDVKGKRLAPGVYAVTLKEREYK